MKTTKEMIEVMRAYENGEEIEYKYNNSEKIEIYNYRPLLNPLFTGWDWTNCDYRVVRKRTLYENKVVNSHGATVFHYLSEEPLHFTCLKL
jgi:hypothetical protein